MGECAVFVCDGEVYVGLVAVSMTVGAVHGVDGDTFYVTFTWSDFAGKVAGECAFWLGLVAGPDAVTVTVSDESMGIFSLKGVIRTMALIRMLVKVSRHLIGRTVC